jgi:aspartate beta-hydroxylase
MPLEDLRLEETLCELKRRRAYLVRHGRGSLEQHLRGTHEVLTRWHQSARVRLAGLLHSAYSTDAFPHGLFQPTERARVRKLIGEEAESLVHLFCSVHRYDLFTALRKAPGGSATALRLASRWGSPPLTLTPQQVGDLLVLYMANAADQRCNADGAPSCWLAEVAEIARWAKAIAETVPPVFAGCTAGIFPEEEGRLLEGYAAALESVVADPRGALAILAGATHPASWVAEPLLWLGFLAIADGGARHAAEAGARAQALLDQWGTAWDKRLSVRHWRRLCLLLLEEAGRPEGEFSFAVERVRLTLARAGASPERLYLDLAVRGAFSPPPKSISSRPDPKQAGDPTPPTTEQCGAIPARFGEYLAAFPSTYEGPWMDFYPGLGARPWHDPQEFAVVRDLERMAPRIAGEFRALDGGRFHDEGQPIGRTGRWSVFVLYERGRWNEENCRLCPATTAVLEAHRTAISLNGMIYFSCLDPNTRLAAHRGPTNLRLRCHLGIEIPHECGLRVGGVSGTWRAGRCIVFDDSLEHESWNESDRRRVVLVVDVWHPDLSEDEVLLLNGMDQHYAAGNRLDLTSYWMPAGA